MMTSQRVNSTLLLLSALSLLFLFAVPGCGSDDPDPIDNQGIDIGDVDPVDIPDVGPTEDADEDPDAGPDTDVPDAGPTEEERIHCEQPLPQPPSGQRCAVEPGSSDMLLLRGTVLAGDDIFDEGSVLVDDQSPNRRIQCVGCDCLDEPAAQDATVVSCPDSVISPGLINPHDHLTFAEGRPQPHGEERFDHRHDWRRGLRGHNQISTNPRSGGHREVVLYGELRMLFGGSTSIAGSTGFTNASGLLRNLDQPFDTEGLDGINVNYSTFPLGDGGFPQLLAAGCGYPNIESESNLEEGIYLPHIAEGIDAEARNELRCLAGESGINLIQENTSIIHGVAVNARDVALIADRGANLVWSPRTNIDLYGNTAPVPLFKRFNVPISLGTDWSTSGSMNMLRELQCADYLNRMYFNETFSEAELWQMATYNGAISMGAEHTLGLIADGYVADITIFDSRGRAPYRSVIDADVDEITLVMRGGEPLYGDAELIEELVDETEVDQCEMIDVCERPRRACIELDTGHSLAEIENEIHPNSYPLFFCEEPEDEPTCVPFRPSEYDGISTPSDTSGDGIPDAMDNCPDYFNPIRPMDGNLQSDINGTGLGDVCDPCPLSEDTTCEEIDPNDWSGDGIPNDDDICPFHYNPDQEDTSGDGIGDACSPCPEHQITADNPCPATIYDVKTQEVGDGERLEILDALVTASLPDEGVFLQVHPDDEHYDGAEYSGVYVFLRNAAPLEDAPFPQAGDRIRLVGSTSHFFGQIQIASVSDLEILSSGHDLPPPVIAEADDVASDGPLQQPLEGTLVTVEDVVVTDTDVPPGPGDSAPTNEFIVDDSLHINNFFYLIEPFPQTGDLFQGITGVLRWANDNSKLEPRFEDDYFLAPPEIDRIEPDLAFLEVGPDPVPTIDIFLTHATEEPVSVDLNYGDTTVIEGPDTVAIDADQDSTTVDLRGLSAQPDPVLVEASYDGLTVSSEVRTYDESTERVLLSLEADENIYFVGDTLVLTATLNIPAGPGGEVISLELTPESSSIIPDEVTVPAGERSVDIDIELGTETGNFIVFATHEQVQESFGFEVIEQLDTQVETFTNFETSGSQYMDGSFVGDAGFPWDYTEARQAPAGDTAPAIDGTSMILRDTTASVGATNIEGGISSFSVEMTQAFTGSGNRQIELFINGDSVATSQAFEGGGEVHEFVVEDLGVTGEFDMEIRAITDRQVTIDNLTWTSGLPEGAGETDFDDASLQGFSPSSTELEVLEDPIPVLMLELEYPALEETVVDLSFDTPDVIEGPDEVIFSPGSSAEEISLRALEIHGDPVTIDATLAGDTVSAEIVTVGPAGVDRFEPDTSALEVTGAPVEAMDLVLERTPQQPVTVQLEYAPEGLLDGPDSLDFAAGQIAQPIELQALASDDDPVTVTASTEESETSAQVLVYDEATPRSVISLTAERQVYFSQEVVSLNAALNIPAGPSGETIDVDIQPTSDATFPAQLTIDANSTEGQLDVDLGDDTGTFVALASLHDTTATMPFEVYSQPASFTESFSSFETSGSSYEDGVFTGDQGFPWTYQEARQAPEDYTIDSNSMILRDSTSSLQGVSIPGGITSFSIDLMQAFTGSGDRQIEVFINDVSIGTSTPFGSDPSDAGEVFEFSVDDILVSDDFDLRIEATTDNQVTIDNLTWTSGYPVDPQDIEFAPLSLAELEPNPAYVEVTGQPEPTLDLHLDYPALEESTVSLDYSATDTLEGPDEIHFSPGQTSASVALKALESSDTPVELTASFEDQEIQATVYTFDDNTPRTITAFQSCHGGLLGQTLEFYVELDTPAGQSGLELPLSIDPEAHVDSAPLEIALSPGQRSTTFGLTFDQQDGPAQVELSTDTDTATTSVNITEASTPLVEDFSQLTSTGGGYGTGDFIGNYELLWEYARAQRTESDAIDDVSIILNKTASEDAWVQTSELPGGLDAFSIDMQKAFTGDEPRQLGLRINGELVASSDVFGESDGDDDTVYEFSATGLDVTCVESLQVEAIGEGQITIDNLTFSPQSI